MARDRYDKPNANKYVALASITPTNSCTIRLLTLSEQGYVRSVSLAPSASSDSIKSAVDAVFSAHIIDQWRLLRVKIPLKKTIAGYVQMKGVPGRLRPMKMQGELNMEKWNQWVINKFLLKYTEYILPEALPIQVFVGLLGSNMSYSSHSLLILLIFSSWDILLSQMRSQVIRSRDSAALNRQNLVEVKILA